MKHVDDRQRMPHADFKIELVMRRRDLQNAGPKFQIDRGVADNGQFLTRKRPPDVLPIR